MALNSSDVSTILGTLDQLRFKSRAQDEFNKMISNDPDAIMRYCREKSSRGSKEQEAVILKAGGDYVIRYMKERSINEWPEAEPLFKTDPKIAIWYAMRQGKPYPEGEDAISQDAKASFIYATEVLKGRFEKGEKAIQTKPGFWAAYQSQFGA